MASFRGNLRRAYLYLIKNSRSIIASVSKGPGGHRAEPSPAFSPHGGGSVASTMRRRTSLILRGPTVDQLPQIAGAVNLSLTVSGHPLRCPAQGHIVQEQPSPVPIRGRLHFIGLFCLLRCVRRKPSPPTPPQPGSVTASVGRQRDRAQARAASRHHCRYFDSNGRPPLRADAQHTARTPTSRSGHLHARLRTWGRKRNRSAACRADQAMQRSSG